MQPLLDTTPTGADIGRSQDVWAQLFGHRQRGIRMVMEASRRAAGAPERAELPVRRWPELRVVVLATAALLLIAVFLASMLSERVLDGLAILFTLPVMLVGLELGARGGVGGAGIAFVVLVAASWRGSELGALGLATSGVVFLAAGALAGRFSARMRAGHRRQERLLASGLRLARLEHLDALPAVLAEELQQTLDLPSVQVQLRGAPAVKVGNPAGETWSTQITLHGIDFGSLTLGAPAGRSFTPEDRIVAVKLALQAAVAADNQRLLASERERAALHAELEHTRQQLASHLRNISQILDSHEAERREIARQLHEGAAQAMAAVLLGLRVLERNLDRELTKRQIEDMRSIARDTLADLRQLAVTVRPPSLDDLGLLPALEGIVERERRSREITLCWDDWPRDLAPEVETCAYHVVEEAIHALGGSLEVRLNVDHDRGRLQIEVNRRAVGERERQPLASLATTRARLELIGGALYTSSSRTGSTGIVAEIPLRVAREPLPVVPLSAGAREAAAWQQGKHGR